MLRPSTYYPGTHGRIDIEFQDEDGTYTDPTTLTLKLMDPGGAITTYVYGTDSQIGKTSTGRFYGVILPDTAGRWHFRWIATGTNQNVASEGTVNVRSSQFVDDVWGRGDYR